MLKLSAMLMLLLCCVGGCSRYHNPDQPTAESQVLTRVTQLTWDFDRAGEGYFSSDMNYIIFQAVPKGEKHYQMFLAQLRWSERPSIKQGEPVVFREVVGLHRPVRISPDDSRNTCGYFSPDGNTLIFASTAGREDAGEPAAGYQREGRDYRWSYPAGMEIFRADGWQGAISAIEPGGRVNLARHPITRNDAYDAEGSISPDGKWIIFTSNRDGDLELYAMKPDGTRQTRLTHAPGYDGGPFFSPDGKRVVYRSDRAGDGLLRIFVADVVYDRAGDIVGLSNERRITPEEHVHWGPYWHPNGRHIVYATSLHGQDNYELYLMRADGSRKTRVTLTPGADVLPVFSPDGKYLMWSSKRTEDNTTQLFIAHFTWPKGI